MLNNANSRGAAPQENASASTNLQELYSPRPVNNNGVGELKTSKSGEKQDTSN